VTFATISVTTYPAWLSAFQTTLGHGCELVNYLWNNLSCMAVNFSNISEILILNGCELFNHLWNKLSCMAVSF